MIDYRELLRKYMIWVSSCEGLDFISERTNFPPLEDFTAEEWEELQKIAKHAKPSTKGAYRTRVVPA